jgi:hypothetical protein
MTLTINFFGGLAGDLVPANEPELAERLDAIVYPGLIDNFGLACTEGAREPLHATYPLHLCNYAQEYLSYAQVLHTIDHQVVDNRVVFWSCRF